MLLKKEYIEGKDGNPSIEKCWYESSNIVYSECVDRENELKTLYVAFRQKDCTTLTYRYDGINVFDYLMFRNDQSQGKALNKHIKGKGEYVKEIKTIYTEELRRELEDFLAEQENAKGDGADE